MPDFGSGYLEQEWNADEQDYISTMDPASIGQMYYNLDPSNEAESAIFWWDMMQEYLPQNNLGFDDWMRNYSQYLPQDYGLGQSQIAAGRRTGMQGIKSMHNDHMLDSTSDRHGYGSSGFAGSGRQERVGKDIWSRYTSGAQARKDNMARYQESIWAAHGQNVLNQLSTLGASGAFTPFEEGIEGTGMGTQPGSEFLGDSGYMYGDQWNNDYEWANAVYDFCQNPDNANTMYYSMCEGWSGTNWEMMQDPNYDWEDEGGG